MRGTLLKNVSLAKHSSLKVGGEAKYLYRPADCADLADFLASWHGKEPLLWLGLGSNTLIRDSGFNGIVIVTQGRLKNIALAEEQTVRVEAGVSCALMGRYCARQGLEGGEFWAGIPGTMGGALRMNAGCFGGQTWDWVSSVETMDNVGNIYHRKASEFNPGYRHVISPKDEWFIAATCNLIPGDSETALARIKNLLEQRANTQPVGKSTCGCVFRNPENNYAARLIEQSGLKGKRIGGVHVSEKHANFFINDGNASAADVENLIYYVADQVEVKTGIRLQREVKIASDEGII